MQTPGGGSPPGVSTTSLQKGILMALDSLQDLFVHELKDLYSAETQITKALPRLMEAANSEELQQAFAKHLQETKGHVGRIENIFRQLEGSPRGKKCAGMEGLLQEGKEVLKEDAPDWIMDAALIGAARRVEHYEIAAYSSARDHAEKLGMYEAVEFLQQTLDEESAADKKLAAIAANSVKAFTAM
jgi:ferritin-like metal-binding protein YciE